MAYSGRSFRNLEPTNERDCISYQYEGVIIDKNINLSDGMHFLLQVLESLVGSSSITAVYKFFPYAEPGLMLQIDETDRYHEQSAGGTKRNICPCGMIHPSILEGLNIDTEQYRGFSFCIILSQIAKYMLNLHDIRELFADE